MKYRINRNPDYSMATSIELIPGQKGEIIWTSMYDRETVIHLRDNRAMSLNFKDDIYEKHKRLSDFDDRTLKLFSVRFNIPIEELMEIRELERKYRNST